MLEPDVLRSGVLILASRTGWGHAEIMAMPSSRFNWWIEGLVDGKPTA